MQPSEEGGSDRRPRILTQEAIHDVIEGLLRQRVKLNASDAEWSKLEGILRRHKELVEYWTGFPDIGQTTKLHDVAKKANKLRADITLSLDDGLGLVLQQAIGNCDLDNFVAALHSLSEFEARSPRSSLRGKRDINKQVKMHEAGLQIELDQWWRQVARCEPVVEEGEVTPYTYFLTQLFRCLSAESLGGSRTAVEGRRRLFRQREERFRKMAARMETLFPGPG